MSTEKDAMNTESGPSEQENEEPARVWEVSCSCGFSAKFRDHDDARDVFDAHGSNYEDGRCGSASMDAMHAYPSGDIDPTETLPEERLADLSGAAGAEVFEG